MAVRPQRWVNSQARPRKSVHLTLSSQAQIWEVSLSLLLNFQCSSNLLGKLGKWFILQQDSYLESKHPVHHASRWGGIGNDMNLNTSANELQSCLLDAHMRLGRNQEIVRNSAINSNTLQMCNHTTKQEEHYRSNNVVLHLVLPIIC